MRMGGGGMILYKFDCRFGYAFVLNIVVIVFYPYICLPSKCPFTFKSIINRSCTITTFYHKWSELFLITQSSFQLFLISVLTDLALQS